MRAEQEMLFFPHSSFRTSRLSSGSTVFFFLSLFSGVVHDSLPFILSLALPRRLHASVQWQRPAHAALGPRVQVSILPLSCAHIILLAALTRSRISSTLSTANLTCTQRPPICPTSRSWSRTTSLWSTSTVQEYWSGETNTEFNSNTISWYRLITHVE